ncbi:MAG: M48 family metalloprotease, partial [Acidobacteriia bacterium]|nr:M48 family metalloprotease [Terriglobia bacterium]
MKNTIVLVRLATRIIAHIVVDEVRNGKSRRLHQLWNVALGRSKVLNRGSTMKVPAFAVRTCTLVMLWVLAFTASLSADNPKRSRSDKNIDAIGHRNIARKPNWYSTGQEAQLGKQMSAALERSAILVRDPTIADYLPRVVRKIAQNSDAVLPITVQVVESGVEASPVTLPGGYQYIDRALLLQLGNECELASVLARGIAHTALHSATRGFTREQMAQIASVPLIVSGTRGESMSSVAVPLTLVKTRRENELDADYFGVQYLYKAGYDPECFIRTIEQIWPATTVSVNAFSPFPPLPQRLKALREEISNLLPKRDGAVVSTPEFEDFRADSWLLYPVAAVAEPSDSVVGSNRRDRFRSGLFQGFRKSCFGTA